MNECTGGSPHLGLVPIRFAGVSLKCAWVRSCEILCIATKKRLMELIGPLVVLLFHVRATPGETDKAVCLKLIGQVWTVTVLLYHWPKGWIMPQMLLFPVHSLGGATLHGEGGRVVWNEENGQEIKRFAVTLTTRADRVRWKYFMRMNEAYMTQEFPVAEELEGVPPADVVRTGTGGEGASRAALAAAQAARESGPDETEDGGPKADDSESTRSTERSAPNAQAKKAGGGKAEIVGDYMIIKTGGRDINLSKKYKARAFLRFAHGHLSGSNGVFYVEDLRKVYNGQFDQKKANMVWNSDRLKEDLFRGLNDGDFELLFEVVDQASDRYRLRI